jgi:hypothetical protein
MRLLKMLGVEYAQGWHIGHPGEIDLSGEPRVVDLERMQPRVARRS